MKSNTQNAKIEAITEKTLVLGIDVLLFRDQLDLREPMVQTDNSQSHRFSLSKYSGHSVIYICRIFKAHQNKHAHALAEIIDAFEPSECHDLRLFPLSNGNQIFPGCSITYPILLHFSGFFVLIQNINDIATGLYVQIQSFTILSLKSSGNQNFHY